MGAPHQLEADGSSGLLGDVLYAGKAGPPVSEAEWVALVHAIATGDQAALHALYERTHHLVFTLMVRIMANRETAEELTLDVFYDVWSRAARYDAAGGTVLGWIMNQARSRALDRLRFDRRQKRAPLDAGEPLPATEVADPRDVVSFLQQTLALRKALAVLTTDERATIQAAYFAELTHAETAERLTQPLGTIKTRIRSALHKLRCALDGGANES